MDNEAKQDHLPDDQRIFDLVRQGANAAIASTSADVARQSEAIKYLEEVTRQVDIPYIGSYYST